MSDKIYKQIEQYMNDTIGKTRSITHLVRTEYWLRFLYPKADEALRIAAITHDIERYTKDIDTLYSRIQTKQKGFTDEEHITNHQNEGARMVQEILKTFGADEEMIERVKMLIAKHEVGGNKDQNLLKDADCISFFENGAPRFVDSIADKVGKEKVREKFDWTFEKITSDKARKIARPRYEEVIKKLEE